LENNEDNRRNYRELLFSAPGRKLLQFSDTNSNLALDWGDYISGVILYEETLYQKAKDGKSFVDLIKEKGAIPGIKVDKVVFSLVFILTNFKGSRGNPWNRW
jgi:fructose-bisphosphate aldolase class I